MKSTPQSYVQAEFLPMMNTPGQNRAERRPALQVLRAVKTVLQQNLLTGADRFLRGRPRDAQGITQMLQTVQELPFHRLKRNQTTSTR